MTLRIDVEEGSARWPEIVAEIIELARSHDLTAYDACHAATSPATSPPLATFDRAMAAVARARGVTLLGPLAP